MLKRIFRNIVLSGVMVITSGLTVFAGGIENFGMYDLQWGKRADNSLRFNAPLTSSLAFARGTGTATFTRASSQWLDVNGTLAEFTIGNAAINSTGVLLEPAGTNLLTYSEDLSNAAWVKENVTITANSTVSPDGNTTADKLTETADTQLHAIYQAASNTNILYSASAFMKQGERRYGYIIAVSGTKRYSVLIDLADGTYLNSWTSNSPTNTSYNIESFGNGWYRLSLTMDGVAASTGYTVVEMSNTSNPTPDATSLDISYAGDITKGLYVWGAGLSTSHGSYIPTTTTTATRAATSLSIPTTGNMRSALPMSGTYDWTPVSIHTANHWQWGSYTDANNATGIFYDGTTMTFRKRIAGVNYDATKALAAVAGTTYRIGWRVNADNSTDVFINGVKGTGHANTTAAVIASTFKLGDDGNSTLADHAQIRNFKTYFTARPDSNM